VIEKRGDVEASLTLLTKDSGGRLGPTAAGRFGCLMVVDGKNFDVRLHLDNVGSIAPGQTVRVPVSFLDWENAKGHCVLGKRFHLREIKTIGEGVIETLST
jgi:hypothetical protein